MPGFRNCGFLNCTVLRVRFWHVLCSPGSCSYQKILPHSCEPRGSSAEFRGFTYLFTILDKTSCWPEAIPLASISAADCARALISGWVLRFGVPAKMTLDCGAQFTSSIWDIVCSLLNLTGSRTTSFHPQSNGLVERFHRSLKSSLRAWSAGPDWCDHLPLVMLGLRSVQHDDSGFSAAEALTMTLSVSLVSSWILTSSLLQFSRTGSSLLYVVWFCLLCILDPNSTEAPSESCLVPTSFLLYRWVPGWTPSL